ncbi:MAG: glycosyltransferase [Pirellulales bacterium]|nr:glycosyltransferase [Pirellulales bacterium]
MRICIVTRQKFSVSETFIHAHIERLPGVVAVIHREGRMPVIDGEPPLVTPFGRRALRSIQRRINRSERLSRATAAYLEAFRRHRPDVLLVEYGTNGVEVMDAARAANIPFVVHFHGADATRHWVIERLGQRYREMFAQAAAIVVVSDAMRTQLLKLGAPQEKLIKNPYGVDLCSFAPGHPENAPPLIVGVGRLTEKKAPHLTLLAFAKAREACPDLRLVLVGDGELRGVCRHLARALGLAEAVAFLGAQPYETIASTLRSARAFVQHSITADDGDSEGMPNSILEAAATGLPVISTRHAGIPEAVVDGRTGLLVDEGDVEATARHMITLARSPALAAELGRAARKLVAESFSMDARIGQLATILSHAVRHHGATMAARDASGLQTFASPAMSPSC